MSFIPTSRCSILLSALALASTAFAAGTILDRDEAVLVAPDSGSIFVGMAGGNVAPEPLSGRASSGGSNLIAGWPVFLGTPGAGFPYTPTLADVDGDGADEIFLTGGHTFGLDGSGSFLPGWPTTEMAYMGYGTNGCKPGPSVADFDRDCVGEVLWTERDWWAGSAYMWNFNGKNANGSNLPGFPLAAPGTSSNALDTPFVLGDSDGDGDLEAWSAHTLGNNFIHYRITVFNHLGALLFTVDLNPNENVLSLYFGDLDGDGVKEMFGVSWLDPAYRLHVFNGNGSEKTGYPITLFTMPAGAYNIFGPPVPADLDGDGDLEILYGYNQSGTSYAVCFHHDALPYAGFPRQVATSSQLFYLGLGDVTGDGAPELLALENYLGSTYRAFAFDLPSGTTLPGWPFSVPNWPKGFPAVVDVDGDGLQEVCFITDGGELYAVSGTGVVVAGFPKSMVSASISGVGAGDIDGDGLFELVAATWDGWVYAWDTTSAVLPGRADWPMRGVNALNTGVFGDDGSYEPLSGDSNSVSAATGGSVTFSLDAGAANAGRTFIMVGSLSGTQPGRLLPGGRVTLPLNTDLFTEVVLSLLNSSVFTNFRASLDGAGEGTAQLNAPPIPAAWVGTTMYYAYALNSPFDFTSNPVAIEIVP
ncbi:MAG: VCBS repeat-containing protein [Planctomycetota bacterium]